MEYQRRRGEYTSNWSDLSFPFSGKPFNVHDDGVFPPQGSTWNPKDSKYTYSLSARDGDFVISASDDTEEEMWTINSHMEWPQRVTERT
jgi:hypothetical protein